MFARKLLDHDGWYLTVDWLGMGKVEVSHYPSKQSAVATPEMKSHFLRTMEALTGKGVPMRSDNIICARAFRLYASAILHPTGLSSRAIFCANPDQVAATLLSESFE